MERAIGLRGAEAAALPQNAFNKKA